MPNHTKVHSFWAYINERERNYVYLVSEVDPEVICNVITVKMNFFISLFGYGFEIVLF